MLKQIYSRARAVLARKRQGKASAFVLDEWSRDPLVHPALSAMSLAQLADLPPSSLRSCCRQ